MLHIYVLVYVLFCRVFLGVCVCVVVVFFGGYVSSCFSPSFVVFLGAGRAGGRPAASCRSAPRGGDLLGLARGAYLPRLCGDHAVPLNSTRSPSNWCQLLAFRFWLGDSVPLLK